MTGLPTQLEGQHYAGISGRASMTAYTVPMDRLHHGEEERAVPGQPVILELESGAPYVIRVLSVDGTLIGHVNRQSSKWLGERLHRGKFVHASISEVTLDPATNHGHGVLLSVQTEPVELAGEGAWWRRIRGFWRRWRGGGR
jgi:hypothetical protein